MKDKRIGVLIFQYHENNVGDFVDICSELSNEITIFTDREYANKVNAGRESDKVSYVLKEEGEPISDYLKRTNDISSRQLDFLFMFPYYRSALVNSLYRYLLFSNCKVVQIVYNANRWSMNGLVATKHLKEYLDLAMRRLVLSSVDAALVEYSTIKKYLSRKTSTEVYSFMSIAAENINEETERDNSKYTLSIPGNIDPERRDYRTFFRTIKRYLSDYQDRLYIQLLGSPSGNRGEDIIQECDLLVSEGWNIDYFSDWISVSEFENRLGESDIIVAPMKKTKQVSAVTERYGVTKGSGCFLDAIKHLSPVVVPGHYNVPPEVDPLTKQYTCSESLGCIIRNFLGDDEFFAEACRYALEEFSIESQSRRLNSIMTFLSQA